jgi:hypothetical protein
METTKETKPQGTNLFQSVNHIRRCDVCGNDYDKCFEVHTQGYVYVFDSLECAIHALAPICAHCGCRIVGHGMEASGVFYCCAHCASVHGVHSMEDRVELESV